ncbi:MAG TPA: ATP-binding protein [Planctomycetota bacterium]|nr:ATP-binding protein [Planctomycetota bacterium]
MNPSPEHLQVRYIAALSAVALLVIIGQAVVQIELSDHSNDARTINIAGRQRMLSQKISKAALALATAPADKAPQNERRDELRAALSTWKASHQALQSGIIQTEWEHRQNSAEVAVLFDAIQPHYESILNAASQIAEARAPSPDHSLLLDAILHNESAFLSGMDSIVQQYERESEARVNRLKRLEIILLALTLAVLTLEALFVFRPAVKKISQAIADLERRTDELKSEIERRIRVELELEKRAADLTASNRDLEAFAYAVSHDLQEPLRSVNGCVQLFERRFKGKLDADSEQLLTYMSQSCIRMKQLIVNVLAYSRIGSQQVAPRRVDTGAAFDRALEDLSAARIDSGAAVTRTEFPVVSGHEVQFITLFQNLLSNAMKYRGAEPPRIHASALRQDGSWLFAVKDNGKGIDPEYHERIFGMFQRLEGGEVGGTGLGLALCRRIVERNGGRMWVESKPGEGSTFYFTVPDKGDRSNDSR